MKPAVKMPKTKYTYLQRDVRNLVFPGTYFADIPISAIQQSNVSSWFLSMQSPWFDICWTKVCHSFRKNLLIFYSYFILYKVLSNLLILRKKHQISFLYMFDVQYQKYAKPSQSLKKSWQGIIARQVIVRWCSKMPWVDEQRLQIASILWIQSAS